MVEQIYRRARAQYGDAGGEMLPIKLLEDLTATRSACRPSRSDHASPARRRKVRAHPHARRALRRGHRQRASRRRCAAPAVPRRSSSPTPRSPARRSIARGRRRARRRRDPGERVRRRPRRTPRPTTSRPGPPRWPAWRRRPEGGGGGGGRRVADRRGQGHRAGRGQPAARPGLDYRSDFAVPGAADRGGADHGGHRRGDQRVRRGHRPGTRRKFYVGHASRCRRPRSWTRRSRSACRPRVTAATGWTR